MIQSFFKQNIRLIYILIILLLIFVILETFFRILFLKTLFLDNHYINIDSWWRLRWIRNRKYNADDIANYFSIYRYDRLLGWNPRANLKNHDIGSGAFLSTNSQGIRGTKEYSTEKVGNTLRIITLGDSFTFGEEVSDNQTFSSFLERKIPGIEVINLGVGGFGHDQMLLKLETEGIKYHPDIVILGFLGTDMERNILSFRDYSKPTFTLNKNNLEIKNNTIPPVSELLIKENFKLKLIDLISLVNSTISEKQKEEETEKITKEIMNEISKTALENKVRMVFIYLPVSREITTDGHNQGEEFFNKYCQQAQNKNPELVNCLNLRPAFREASKKGNKFRGGHYPGHYDANAHSLIAGEISKFIKINNILPIDDTIGL